MVLKKAALRKDVFKSIKLFADEHNMEYEDACDLFYEVVNETVGGNEKETPAKVNIGPLNQYQCKIHTVLTQILKELREFKYYQMSLYSDD